MQPRSNERLAAMLVGAGVAAAAVLGGCDGQVVDTEARTSPDTARPAAEQNRQVARDKALPRRHAIRLTQRAYVKASNTGAWDFFGYSVALSGDTLAVGAPTEDSASQGVNGDQHDDSASDSGAVYVFRRTGPVWRQEAYLKASNTGSGDFFGNSVALSGDTLAVGARREASASQGINGNQDDNSASGSGAVYVFRRTGTAWQQEAYLKASNTGATAQFGTDVTLSGDTLAVGASGEDSASEGFNGNQDNDGIPESGAVYMFRRTGTTWQQEAYLKAANSDDGDYFGHKVALAGDILAVGSQNEDSASQGLDGNQADDSAVNSGAVSVFRRSGTSWQQQAYIKASNTGIFDYFGRNIALSDDILAVGTHDEASASQGIDGNQADDSAPRSGAVYLFH